MSIAQVLLDEFNAQAPITREFLERLPADQLTWKPHAKSLTAGQLAFHLAHVPGSVAQGAQPNVIPPPAFQFPQPDSLDHVLKTFEETITTVGTILPTFTDAEMNATWRIMAGDKELFAIPRQAFLRDIILNHWYQHRGQFSVYLRFLNVPVPASWGPSADESVPFQAT